MSSLCDKCGMPGGKSRPQHECRPGGAIWAMIEALRADEGNTVTILCDNPEGTPNSAVECCGDWTDWQQRRFTGDTVFRALEAAHTSFTTIARRG